MPAVKLRAEFGGPALARVAIAVTLRLAGFAVLCLLGSRFFVA